MIFKSIPIILFLGGISAQLRSTALPPSIVQNVDPYRHTVNLDSRGKYVLEWSVDWKEQRVYFNVTASTNGWVGFGLSKKGTMKGADIVIGGVDKGGKAYFSDRHALDSSLPEIDASQDWTLHEAWERGVWTFLSFSRPFDTCDKDGDLVIDDNLLSVIWAYSERDDDIQYHFQTRGAYDVYLLDPNLSPKSLVDTLEPVPQRRRGGQTSVFQMREQMILPAQETMYYCSFHRVPTIVKHHIIGFHGTTYPSNREQRLAHRLLLYRCRSDPESIQELEQASRDGGGECYPPVSGPTALQRYFFPEHVGVPMSESGTEYFMLQVHYDNPNLLSNASVTLSLDAYYTRDLRENDASLLILGSSVPGATNLIIPPSSLNYIVTGHCAPGCTTKMFPPQGVNIVSAFLHTHPTGKKVSLAHYRNGKELPWILRDNNFNPYYLQMRLLREERKILQGDQLIHRCVYDTTRRNGTVVTGSYGIKGELCLAFVYYYTRVPGLITCLGGITAESYQNLFGIRNTTFDLALRETVVTDPTQFAGLTVSDYLTNYINWDIKLRNEVQEHHLYQPQTSSCPAPAVPTLPPVIPTNLTPNFNGIRNEFFSRRTTFPPLSPTPGGNERDFHSDDGFGPRYRNKRAAAPATTFDYVNGRVVQTPEDEQYPADIHYNFNDVDSTGATFISQGQRVIQRDRIINQVPRVNNQVRGRGGINVAVIVNNNWNVSQATPFAPSVIPPVVVMTVSNREESIPPQGGAYKLVSKCGAKFDYGNGRENSRGRNEYDNNNWRGQGQVENNIGYGGSDGDDYYQK
ncbi:DBH-like monooxygenase protein 2 [Orchesella cincta]|uniref:DBH-like monooxygenase protein 2 n=1 Tax=Orchesella cincta TaxID=48709 RepID=A0A1D2MK40_ORCCI|nr:DBH-like monooxygenase protein 2 [Orchesella cincta]